MKLHVELLDPVAFRVVCLGGLGVLFKRSLIGLA